MPKEAPPAAAQPPTASQHAFRNARPQIQEFIKRVLKEERQVLHMQRRGEIHAAILEAIKSIVQ